MQNKVDQINPTTVDYAGSTNEVPILGPGSVNAIKNIEKPGAKVVLRKQVEKMIARLKEESGQSL